MKGKEQNTQSSIAESANIARTEDSHEISTKAQWGVMSNVLEPEKGSNKRDEIRPMGAMASGDPDQSGALAGNNKEGSKDQEMTDDGNNNAGGGEDRDEGTKAVGEKEAGSGTPEGQEENNMNIGTGCLTVYDFMIILFL